MSSREAFEAWFKTQYGPLPIQSSTARVTWIAWQAAEKQALDRAAMRLDEYQKNVWQHIYWECAANIVRSLMQGASSEKEQNNG